MPTTAPFRIKIIRHIRHRLCKYKHVCADRSTVVRRWTLTGLPELDATRLPPVAVGCAQTHDTHTGST
jgi:hypothetical protein